MTILCTGSLSATHARCLWRSLRSVAAIVGVLMGLTSMVSAGSNDTSNRRPNVLLIVVDDLGYGELGCYGGTEIPTPHMDALAASGVRFTSGYVTAPFCAASRAALMTGRYQTRFGFEFNPIGAKNVEPGVGLPIEEKSIAERLRDVGYATALAGKWHLGGTAPFHPQRRGFDEFFGFLHEGHFYAPPPWSGMTTWLRRKSLPDGGRGRWTSPDGRIIWSTHLGTNEHEYDTDNPLLRGSQPVNERADLTAAFTREARDFIARHPEQPFFLTLAYNAVHSPMQATDAYMARFAHIDDIHRRIFAAMLAQLDDSIGELREQLRTSGIEENTLIAFVSDNGGPTRELTSRNNPLRGGKGELREGGIRVPFFISWKGQAIAGRSLDVPVSSLDIAATVLDAAGVTIPANEANQLDGVSLRMLLSGRSNSAPHETLFWRVGRKHALRHGDWKLINEGVGDWQLFNVSADIGETSNLAAQETSRVKELMKRWDEWSSQQAEPLWR